MTFKLICFRFHGFDRYSCDDSSTCESRSGSYACRDLQSGRSISLLKMAYGTGSITANVMADSAVSLLNDNASPDDGNPLSPVASPHFQKYSPCQTVSLTEFVRVPFTHRMHNCRGPGLRASLGEGRQMRLRRLFQFRLAWQRPKTTLWLALITTVCGKCAKSPWNSRR